MLKTNKENLVKWSVQGKIHHPLGGNYRIAFDRYIDGTLFIEEDKVSKFLKQRKLES